MIVNQFPTVLIKDKSKGLCQLNISSPSLSTIFTSRLPPASSLQFRKAKQQHRKAVQSGDTAAYLRHSSAWGGRRPCRKTGSQTPTLCQAFQGRGRYSMFYVCAGWLVGFFETESMQPHWHQLMTYLSFLSVQIASICHVLVELLDHRYSH